MSGLQNNFRLGGLGNDKDEKDGKDSNDSMILLVTPP
jgi:hypothetical protein